jgi:pimeloyl-ACP methyl ester carboxylesterase
MAYITVEGFQIHYESVGPDNAPCIVLVHGLTNCLKIWRRVFDLLSAEYHVIALDLLGHGESEKPAKSALTIERQGSIVLGLMDVLGIQCATIIGHSMGGEISLWIASHHPERVEKLVVIAAVTEAKLSPTARFNVVLIQLGIALPWLGHLMTNAFRSPKNPLRQWLIERVYFGRPQPESAFREIYDEQMRFDNYSSKASAIRGVLGYCALDDAEKIRAPLLIIGAERDRIVPVKQALALKGRLPQAGLLLIPNCGHFVQYDAPDELNAALVGFLHS